MPHEDQNCTKSPSSTRKGMPHKRPRKRLSCEPCRISKLRCDRQQPCSACRRRERESACSFRRSRDRVINTTTISEDESASHVYGSSACLLPPENAVTTANTADDSRHPAPPTIQRPATNTHSVPASGRDDCSAGREIDPLASFAFGPERPTSELLDPLPSESVREFLISRYFTYQAPLFHILHGPTFQQQYEEFSQDPTQASLSWLALLFTLCSLGVQTLETSDSVLRECQPTWSEADTCDRLSLYRHFRSAALACLSEARFMIRYDLNTLEALLIMTYGICHSEGVDRPWIFLGIAFNMGVVLRCNANNSNHNFTEQQRRWRCWAGIRTLYTYQGILFRDVDPSFLLSVNSPMPAEVNDSDIRVNALQEASTYPNSMSVMKFKLRLFELSTQICSCLSNSSTFDVAAMKHYDALIRAEQQQWTSAFLPSGRPSFFDTAEYAYWCILETYAYQLYLLVHRPFYHSQSPHFLPSSRKIYAESCIALLETYEKLCELPTLRPYRWLVNGMTSFNALQGVVALAACLLDAPGQDGTTAPDRVVFDAAVLRIKSLRKSSPVCERAHSAIQAIQTQISTQGSDEGHVSSRGRDASVDWLDMNSIDWAFWENSIEDSRRGAQR
ncbi:fungal transcriptional regulatory n-terminal [Fusarium heterosporum]|uniref:Fungal transcriptional regulatory n-terminal n=1 Tax=Fusarium heterosporum TaxID=42747 RepID=A0A8H5TPW6_FUSHE|nr:fungal transcriptional regulatory n-terminal [Fusarium heterosporum]